MYLWCVCVCVIEREREEGGGELSSAESNDDCNECVCGEDDCCLFLCSVWQKHLGLQNSDEDLNACVFVWRQLLFVSACAEQ